MKKKGLLVVVALLALASLMATMAFSTAMVPNNVRTAIVPTDEALVSIVENPNFTDFASIADDGKMYIDFTKAGTSGFQPGSTYVFNDLFYIKNNITKPIKVGLRFDSLYKGQTGNHPKGLHVIETSKRVEEYSGTDYLNALVHFNGNTFTGGYYEGRVITLQPGEQIGLDWTFKNSYALDKNNQNCTLQVHARVDGR